MKEIPVARVLPGDLRVDAYKILHLVIEVGHPWTRVMSYSSPTSVAYYNRTEIANRGSTWLSDSTKLLQRANKK